MTLPVYAINLDRCPERWATLGPNLQAVGANSTRIPAVDGLKLEENFEPGFPDWATIVLDSCSEQDNRGNIGCALSHVKAWTQAFEADGHHAAIVLEDDVLVTADMLCVAQEAIALSGHSATIVWLSCETEPRLAVHQGRSQPLSHRHEDGGVYGMKPVKTQEWMNQGCRGYAITAEAAQVVLSQLEQRQCKFEHIDMLLLDLCTDGIVSGFFVRPHVVSAVPELNKRSVRKEVNQVSQASQASKQPTDFH